MHKLYELKDKLLKELEGYAANGKYSKDDVEAIKYIASAIDHICNIVDDEDEYSGGMYNRGGSYRSYARGRKRDAMGRYASDGYSRGDMMSQLEGLVDRAPDERTRQEMQKFINKMESIM